MLHDPYPVVDLLGQISRSNAWSKLSVKIVGRILWSNCWSNLSVELLGQIPGSNLWVKLGGHVTSGVTSVTSHVTSNAANQTQPILGPPLASLGARMGAPTDSLKTGKDGREMGKEKPHASQRGVWWLAL